MSTAAQGHPAALLAESRAAGLDRVDAMALLAHVSGRSRAWLIAHDDEALPAPQVAQFHTLCQQRQAGVPVAYLVGMREFHGLSLRVTPDVLVPRPDTETLVDWALDRLAGPLAACPAPAVLDLGTGSGAIALAVRHRHPQAQVCGVDLSEAALAVAADNGRQLGLPVDWQLGNWWQAVPGRVFDLVLSNPPYIAGDDPHLGPLRHEPRGALTPEGDGLAAFADILAGAPAHLKPGAWLLFEHGYDQASAVCSLLAAHGWQDVQSRHDLAGHARCSGGRWPGQ